MDEARDTQAGVLDVLRAIERNALETGWSKIGYRWVCPECAKYMREHHIKPSVLDD